MSRWLFVLFLSLTACSYETRVKKLSDEEFKAYYALKPFMDEDQRKTYLKMKLETDRTAYLKEQGLWDRFYKYDDATRALIIAGKVELAWTKDMLEMAWGVPFDKRKLAGRDAQRSELWVYRFEQQKDGVLVWEPGSKTQYQAVRLFERDVTLDDDKVVSIEERTASF